MKNIKLTIVFLFVLTLYSFAQNPVLNITDKEFPFIENAYYKDLNNYYEAFVGTWKYDNGAGTVFTIQLRKAPMSYSGFSYTDLVVGEYKFVKNGATLINTLPNFNTVYTYEKKHNISAESVCLYQDCELKCPDCTPNDVTLRARLSDDVKEIVYSMWLRPVLVNGQQVLRGYLYTDGKVYGTINTGDPLDILKGVPVQGGLIIPKGDYDFVKQ